MGDVAIFLQIGLMIIVATLFSSLLRYLKQPTIPGYILAGIIIGPVLGLVKDLAIMNSLAEIGIAFLLFIVGLELNLKKLKDIGSVASIGAFFQIIILFFLGLLTSIFLGYSFNTGIYLGLIMAFSSTMVVVKLLSDKHQLDTLHGRIVIGILLMQDIVAIIALTVIKDLQSFSLTTLLMTLVQGLALLIIAYILGKHVFPQLFKFAAKNQELLFLVSISVCFTFSIFFALAGFNIAIGAFVAGVTLANLPYNLEIVGKTKSLRDFFSVLFFTAVGAELVFTNFSTILLPLIIFTLFTIILLPLITIIITSFFGYTAKTSFMTGISLAQVSEFGFIIALIGKENGIFTEDLFSMTVFLALITMAITAYFIKYDDWFYKTFGKWVKTLDHLGKTSRQLAHLKNDVHNDHVLVGMDRIGYSIFRKLRKLGKRVVVVDFNPDIIKRLLKQDIPCIYGDVADPEIMEQLHFKHVKLLISTIPDHNDNLILLKKIRQLNPHTIIILTSYTIEEALDLYEQGAHYVIIPHYLGGEHVSLLLEDITTDLDKLITTKLAHIHDLRHRKELHPHHR